MTIEASGMPARRAFAAAVAILALVLAFFVEILWIGRSLLAEGRPVFDFPHVLRTILLALTAAGFVASTGGGERGPTAPGREDTWSAWGRVHWNRVSAVERHSASSIGIPLRMLIVAGVGIGVAGVTLASWTSPWFFDAVAREDGPVETLSAILMFGAAIALGGTVLRPDPSASSCAVRLGRAGLAVVLLVVAAEEVSWFQRALDIETPDAFRSNAQGEMNLHNFHTSLSENAYYTSGFVFLTLLPFLADHGRLPARFAAGLVPDRFVLFAAAPAAALNYDMWNVVFIQLGFFGALFIMMHYGLRSYRRDERILAGGLATLLVVMQVTFFAVGDSFPRPWVLTEYRELMIPVGCALFAFACLTAHSQRKAAEA